MAREGAAVVAIRGAGLVLCFASQVVVARALGAAAFGAYAYLFAMLALFAVPARIGSDIASVRFVAAYRAGERAGLLAPYLRWTAGAVGRASAVVAVAWFALLATGVLAPDGLSAAQAGLAVAALPLLAAVRVGEGALRGGGRVVDAFVPYHVAWPALLVVAVWAFGTAGGVSLTGVLAAQLAAFAVAAAAHAVAVARLVGRSAAATTPSGADRAAWRRATLVLGLYSLFGLVLGQLDVVVVGALLDPATAGRYAAAWRVATLVAAVPTAFNLVFAPRVAALWADGDVVRLEHVLRSGMALVLAATVPLALVVVALRHPVLALFGDGYGEAGAVLVVLCAAQVAIAAGGPVGILLNMTGHERDGAVVLGVAAAVNVAVALALVPVAGMAGAAWATAVCTVGWNAALWSVARRRLGVRPFGRRPGSPFPSHPPADPAR